MNLYERSLLKDCENEVSVFFRDIYKVVCVTSFCEDPYLNSRGIKVLINGNKMIKDKRISDKEYYENTMGFIVTISYFSTG